MRTSLALAALVALAACAQGEEDAGDSADDFARRTGMAQGGQAQTAAQVAEVNAQPVVAPTGTAQLTPLSPEAPRALGAITGGCSFVYQGRSLFVAGAPETEGAAGNGVLVVGGRRLVVGANQAGGPGAIEAGPAMAGEGYTVRVDRAEGDPQVANGRLEWPADLIVAGPEGETRFSPGTWSCIR